MAWTGGSLLSAHEIGGPKFVICQLVKRIEGQMKKIFAMAVLMCSLSTTSFSEPTSNESPGWSDFNQRRIAQFINTVGRDNANYDEHKKPYAVFDWDNTCTFLDTEESTLQYQLRELRFAANPVNLKEALIQGVPSDPQVQALTDDIVDSYQWLYSHSDRLRGDQPIEEIQKSDHWLNFVVKYRHLYDLLEESFGPQVAYPWLTYRFFGMTRQEVQQLGCDAVNWQLDQPIENLTLSSSPTNSGRSGVVKVHLRSGFRLIPEMQWLLNELRANGIDVWICTASFADVIEGVSSSFGYGCSPDQLIGMNLEREQDGRISNRLIQDYPMTYGIGKTEAIKRFLVKRYGSGPLLVAGDSDGDQAMLQDFPETQISLIIDLQRSPSSKIGQLAQMARQQRGSSSARYLLQHRSESTGRFISVER